MRDIDDYVKKYNDEPFEAEMVQIRKHEIIKQCKKYNHSNILEIGCAMNPFFLDFHDYENMVIVEPGKEFANNARRLLSKEKNQNITIIDGCFEDNLLQIKALGMKFDIVILSSVLHEIDNPQKMLQAIFSVCDSDTVVHINVPNAKSLHRILAKEMGLIEDIHEQSEQMKLMQRRRTYDIDLLQNEVLSAGFTVMDRGSYFVKPFTHGQLQKCLTAKIIDRQYIDGLVNLIKFMPEYGAEIYINCKKCKEIISVL